MKNKNLYLIALAIFMIAVISFGTYALWDLGEGLFTTENTITSGQVSMSFSEKNEITLSNALPMSDTDGKLLGEYFDFSLSTYIKTNANDSTSRKSYYNVLLEKLSPTTNTTALQDSEIKVYLTEVASNGSETQILAPTTIDKLSNYLLTSGSEEFKNNKSRVEKNFRLRAWIDYNVNASKFNGATRYSYNFRVNINNEKPQPGADKLIAKVGTGGLEQVTHTVSTANNLQVPSGTITEYRYRGASSSLNNYVTFNNETWRIIGVIPTDDGTGNIENRIKIIKPTSLGEMYWDESNSNNWARPATLNTYLNNDYYNTLSNEAKSMIGPTKYYLGGYDSNPNVTTDVMWQYERKTSGSDYYKSGNPNSYTGNIAIMYVSDYGYAASNLCSNSTNLNNYNTNSCPDNNWLFSGSIEWLLSQYAGYSTAFRVYSTGFVNYTMDLVGQIQYEVRPVLSLSSNVKITGGTGVPGDEYKLSL